MSYDTLKNVHLAEHGANPEFNYVADRQHVRAGDDQVTTAKRTSNRIRISEIE
jgi:hypothetical protein